jgi:hypothetical protein
MKNDKDNLTQKEWEIENSNLTEEELKRNWAETLKRIRKRVLIASIWIAACFGLSKHFEEQWNKYTPYPQGATIWPITEDTLWNLSDTLQSDRQTK